MKPSCSCAQITFLFVCVTSLLLPPNAKPQNAEMSSRPISVGTTANGRNSVSQSTHASSDATYTSFMVKGDSTLALTTVDLNAEVDLIVQFTRPPLARMMKKERRAAPGELLQAMSLIENDQRLLEADVQSIEARERSKSGNSLQPTTSEVRHRYRRVLNGVTIRTRRWMVSSLQQLPYVKSIEFDAPVKAHDEASNHVIGADSVWARTGAQGDGVLIGILDTGIDYTHPDLGGGIGPGFKVVGGIDLVNGDHDPMDDRDHGTHVAGIAAADGPGLKGVAPHAKLLAVKVLDASGSGYVSTAIAGMEYALDPDGDPGTDDGVDVMNMSFGSQFGMSDDAQSTAANEAVLAGAVCVVSAGNDGPYYESLGSPGMAERVVTVGAADNADIIASFSSRGPVPGSGSIKPDLVAPGVGIRSTVRGGWAWYNGTSMAAPHVTGAAALLKQLHPGWTPENIKAVLMQSARDLGADAWTQGSGRLNIEKATHATIAVSPPSLYFGCTDMTLPAYARAETLTVRNLTNGPRTYAPSWRDLPPGTDVSFSPSVVSIPGNDSATVVATLHAITPSIPDAGPETHAYAGRILFVSTQDTATIHVSFVHYPHLNIDISGANLDGVYIHNRRDFAVNRNYSATGVNTMLFLPRDTYDLMVRFETYPGPSSSIVVRENLIVPSTDTVVVKAQEATTLLVITPTRIDGTSPNLAKCDNAGYMIHKQSGFGYGFYGSIPQFLSVRFNRLSSAYTYDWYLHTFRARSEYYAYYGGIDDFSASHLVTFEPGSFKHLAVQYTPPPGVSSQVALFDWTGVNPHPADRHLALGASTRSTSQEYLSAPFRQDWYLTPLPRKQFPQKSGLINYTEVWEGGPSPAWDRDVSRLYYRLSTFQAIDRDTVQAFPFWFTDNIDLKFTGESVVFGLGPPHWNGVFVNSSSVIDFKTNTPYGYVGESYPLGQSAPFAPLFASQFQDFSPKELYYRVLRQGAPIDSGRVMDRMRTLVTNGYYDRRVQIAVTTSGQYALQMRDTSYSVRGRRGSAFLNASFDLGKTDKNPPTLVSFNVLDGNEFTDFIPSGRQGKIRFVLNDNVGIQQARLYCRAEADTTWQELSTVRTGPRYEGNLPADLTGGYCALRVVASDQAENVLDYLMDPALLYGVPVPVQLSSFTATALDDPHWVRLTWTTLSETNNLGYEVQKAPAATGIYQTLQHSFVPGHGTTLNPQHYVFLDSMAAPGLADYRLKQIDLDGTIHFSEPCRVNVATGVNEGVPPKEFTLAQNYPNPFNPVSTIRYGLPKRSHVTLTVFNALGQQIARQVSEVQEAGWHEWKFDGSGLASGVYFYRLQAGNFFQTRKMLLVR